MPSYSPSGGNPRYIFRCFGGVTPRQALVKMTGQMLAAQGHIASPRLKHT